jgi:hypothetical protein
MAMAAGMTTGQGFLHWQVSRASRVLYVDGEMPPELMQERLADARRRVGRSLAALFTFCWADCEELAERFPELGTFAPLNAEEGQQFILNLAAMLGRIDVIIFDNRMSLLSGDMKDEEPWTKTMLLVKELTRRRIAQIWIDHTGHDAGKIYGTKTKEWQFDAVALLTEADWPGSDVAFTLEFTKARRRKPSNRADFEKTTFAMVGDVWQTKIGAAGARKLPRIEAAALAVLTDLAQREGKQLPDGRITVLEGAWRDECDRTRQVSMAEEKKSRTTAFRRASTGLLDRKLVHADSGLVWLPVQPEPPDFDDVETEEEV